MSSPCGFRSAILRFPHATSYLNIEKHSVYLVFLPGPLRALVEARPDQLTIVVGPGSPEVRSTIVTERG